MMDQYDKPNGTAKTSLQDIVVFWLHDIDLRNFQRKLLKVPFSIDSMVYFPALQQFE